MRRQPGCPCEFCGLIDWRFKVLSFVSRLDDWCYGQQRWVPFRAWKATENLHWRVQRWAMSRNGLLTNSERRRLWREWEAADREAAIR